MRKSPLTKKIRNWGISVSVVAVAAALLLQSQIADTASGCCSRHNGICECQCCDGTPLSERCLARIPECAATHATRPAAAATGPSSPFSGMVTTVKDGDTIVVQHGQTSITIRLADIDCPEISQAFGTEALSFTQRMTLEKTVTVVIRAIDKYGRSVADVYVGHSSDGTGTSVNAALVRAGLAWWYRDYSKDKTLEALEKDARAAHRGLWSNPSPIPPWVYRRRESKDRSN